MIYRPVYGCHLPSGVDYQAVGERLAQLRDSAGSGFTPALIVEDAKPDDSPLHMAGFTWDIKAAAQKQWLEEAMYLTRSIVVVYRDDQDKERETRAFVNVIERESEEPRYISVVDAMSDDDYRQQVIDRALSEALSWRRRYEDIKEFGAVFGAIERVAATHVPSPVKRVQHRKAA